MGDTDYDMAGRQQYLGNMEIYAPFIDDMDSFTVYVLDKFEAVLRSENVLDYRLYADTPEICAWLLRSRTKALMLKPQVPKESYMVAGPYDVEQLSTVEDVRGSLTEGSIDYVFLHYDRDGPEHYDVTSFSNGGAWNINAAAKSRVVSLLAELLVLQALKKSGVDAARAAMFAK